MALTFTPDHVYQQNFVANVLVGGSGDVFVLSLSDDTVTLDGTITVEGDSVTATLGAGGSFDLFVTNLDDPTAIIFSTGGGTPNFFAFSNTDLTAAVGTLYQFAETGFNDAFIVPCFAAGTRILTRRGEVAVEDLEVGDEAMALLGGGFSAIKWIGSRQMECAKSSHPADQWPVRVSAGAFGPGRPHRDLMLSPDHAVFYNGSLIPVRYLENGITVARAPVESVTYFHVELDRHDVLLAEGLPAESYLDTGNRSDFAGVGRDATSADAHENTARQIWAEKSCAPLHVSGPVLANARLHLAERAAEMGLGEDVNPDLRLCVGAHEVRPTLVDGAWHFELPELTAGAKLVSFCGVPAMTVKGSVDQRCLGVPVTAIQIDGRPVALDAPFLRAGWYKAEDGLRWTTGMAQLPPLRSLTLQLAQILPRGTVLELVAAEQANAA